MMDTFVPLPPEMWASGLLMAEPLAKRMRATNHGLWDIRMLL